MVYGGSSEVPRDKSVVSSHKLFSVKPYITKDSLKISYKTTDFYQYSDKLTIVMLTECK